MTNNSAKPESVVTVCPLCREQGKPVEGQTVKANISVSLRKVGERADYYFCRTKSCPVVYFDDAGEQTFDVDQIRVPVYQKQPNTPDVKMCYCFRYTVGEIKTATEGHQQEIIEDINAGIKAGQCACDLRNPQGSCCLGNIRRLISTLEE
jgi:hypothetical protein